MEYNIFVKYRGYRIEFSEEKNLLLKETREVCFEDVLQAVEGKDTLGDLKHTNKKYAYAVPYVIDPKRKVIFLKTVYPSRVLTDKYIKGGEK